MASTWLDLVCPDEREAGLAFVRRLLAGRSDECAMSTRYVRKDGVPVWLNISASLVRPSDGTPDYFAVTAQDITERKAMEALTDTALSDLALDDLLRELLSRLVAVMGVDNVAILLLDADFQTLTVRAARGPEEVVIGRAHVPVGQGFAGRIAATREPLIVNDLATADVVNPVLREHLCSVVGVPLLVEEQVEGHPHREDRPMSRLIGVMHIGSAVPRCFTEADVHLLQRAADRVAWAIHHKIIYAAEQDARQQGETALARAVVSEAEAADRASRLHTILETMTDGVAVYDVDGRCVQLNRAFRELVALERAPAGFDSLSVFERVHLLDLRDAVTNAPLRRSRLPVARALRGETVTGQDADIRLRAFDGRELEVNASAVPLAEMDGRIVGAVAVVCDVTERNRLAREREASRTNELAAREMTRRMDAFLATAAHDLRSPLSTVVGYLALAESACEKLAIAAHETASPLMRKVAAVRDRVQDAQQGTDRLTRLLTRLFDLAAIRAGKLELRPAPCDLAMLVREQVEALRVGTPGRTIRLRLPADGAPILVEADADRIAEVVTNYLANALKYSPPDFPVDISVETQRNQALVAVRDAGPGIPKADCKRIWDLFHRASEAAAHHGTHNGGLGLGLYICKAIIEAHYGKVGVKSKVGEGSTFWFTLPLAQATTE